jgi:hypothetical protein
MYFVNDKDTFWFCLIIAFAFLGLFIFMNINGSNISGSSFGSGLGKYTFLLGTFVFSYFSCLCVSYVNKDKGGQI